MKNGCIYGISYKPGGTLATYVKKFRDYTDAQEWLGTEEYDFRERELCSKTRAIKMIGKSAVDLINYIDM